MNTKTETARITLRLPAELLFEIRRDLSMMGVATSKWHSQNQYLVQLIRAGRECKRAEERQQEG